MAYSDLTVMMISALNQLVSDNKKQSPTLRKHNPNKSSHDALDDELSDKPLGQGTATETSTESRDSVLQQSESAQQYVQQVKRNLKFEIDDSQGDIKVNVYNGETEEFIRSIPSHEIHQLAAHLHSAQGILIKTKV